MKPEDYRRVVSSGYDVIADEYLQRVTDTRETPELREQIERHITALRSRVAADGKIIDLGCGAGLPFTASLSKTFDVTGVDFSSRQIELARINVPGASFVQADMTEVGFSAGSYDAVTAFFSIIHVPRSEHPELFTKIANWLKPGGVFLASLGKRGDEEDWDDDWLGARMFWSYHNPEKAKQQIFDAGFRIEYAEHETVENGIDGPETFFWVMAMKNEVEP